MATRTIAIGGGNYNSTGTWVEGAVPTSADDVVCLPAGASGQLTVNVSSAAKTIDFTNYTNTLTMNALLTVSGSVTLVSAMTISGSSGLTINGTATLTSNTKTFPNLLTINAFTITFSDNWTVGSFATGGTCVLDGNTLNVTGNCTTNNNISGTTIIDLTGTGTLSGGGQCFSTVRVNTSGTITIGTWTLRGATFTYVTGTTTCNGTVTIVSTACIFDTSGSSSAGATTTSSTGINFNILTVNAAITNNSNLCVVGTFNINASISSSSMYAGSSVTIGGGSVFGTLTMNGTGNLTAGSTVQSLPIIFNTSGTITVGSMTVRGCTFTYTAGTIVTTATTLICQTDGSTFNTNGMSWNNITFSTLMTTTINSLLTINGTLSLNQVSQTFAGTSGWTCATLSGFTTAGQNLTLQASNTYIVTTSATVAGTSASHCTIGSSSGTVKAIFTVNLPATQDIGYCNGTRIDSSGGQTIYSYKGTLTSTINWAQLPTQPPVISYAF